MGGEAIFNQKEIFHTNREELQELKKESLKLKDKSVRICLHNSPDDDLHEMLIVHKKDDYVKPHKHLNKSESFHIVEGEMDVFIFNDSGEITQKIGMGDYNSGKPFCYRLSSFKYHTVLPKTKFVVFHEVTNGPFRREETIWGDWAPNEGEINAVKFFIMKLKKFTPDSI